MLLQMGPLVLERVATVQKLVTFLLFIAFRPSLSDSRTFAAAFYPRLFRGSGNLSNMLNSGRELKFMSIIGGALALPFALYPDVVIRILLELIGWKVEVKFGYLGLVVVLQSINYPLADALTTKGFQARTAVLIVAGLLGICLISLLAQGWGR